jgi:outer membrane lipoprotein-sorting protein
MFHFLLLLVRPTPAATDALDRLAAALRGAAAWQAAFVQKYTPEGFQSGTTEKGTLTLSPPSHLRFDYTSGAPRVFASDGSVGRLVDPGAGSCEAVRLDAGAWGRLPLAAALDPPAARRAFLVDSSGQTLRLIPKDPTPELAEITIDLEADGLPTGLTVRDASGNRNEFVFTGWKSKATPLPSFFRPSLAGAPPCVPEE